MTVYPAIDLRGGHCVRLWQGAFDRETVYGDDPVAVARRFEADGAAALHVVDLDGARVGHPVQARLVATICAAVRIPVQVGGGLRDRAAVDAVLAAGAARAVLGTVAVRAPELARALCRAHPGRIAIGLDARDGCLRVAGWSEETTGHPAELAARVAGFGAAAVVYTDIGRDGTGQGPDIDGTRRVARAAGVPVIASGGIGSLGDVRAVAALAADGVAGVIIGRALYTGAVRLPDALAVAEAA
jgi:phosphoribosylformimino-5-aminoimidazole carboxamide ribotide isomerase